MKSYYPIMLNIEGKNCIVIGGGKVAERKVKSLLEYGANVTVISPESTKELNKLEKEGLLRIEKRPYKLGDLQGSFLVYVATGVSEVNEACRKEGETLNILVNVVDVPSLCDFIVPAIHRQGRLTLTVSTDGKSPMFSRKIREELEVVYGPRYRYIIDTMGEIREKALEEIKDIGVRRELFQELAYGVVLEDIEDLSNCQQKMWSIYRYYRSREGCDRNENNKNRL